MEIQGYNKENRFLDPRHGSFHSNQLV